MPTSKANHPSNDAEGSSWGRRGLVLLWFLLSSIVVVELGLRVASSLSPSLAVLLGAAEDARWAQATSLEQLLASSPLGFRPRHQVPGFVLNSRGLRSPEYRRDKEPQIYRVLALGDSFAFSSGGVPHASLWSTLVAEWLRQSGWPPRAPEEDTSDAEPARRIEMLNLGVPGVGPGFVYRMWQLEGMHLQPDLVLATFFVGNDFSDEATDEAEGSLLQRSQSWRAWRLLGAILRASRQELPTIGPQRERGGFEVIGYRRRYEAEGPRLPVTDFLAVEATRLELLQDSARLAELAPRALAAVAALSRSVKAQGGRFLLLVVPDVVQVDPRMRAQVLAATGGRGEPEDLDIAQGLVADFCEREAIDCLDLLPGLRSVARARPLYRQLNTHWNRAGNRLAAGLIASHLSSTVQREGDREPPTVPPTRTLR